MNTMRKSAFRLFILGCLAISLLTTTEPAPAAPALQAVTNNAIAVRAGGNRTCVLMANGEVRCWGANQYGQLGTDIRAGQTGPKLMSGLTGIVKNLSNTYKHSCVLTTSGGVKCWGYNGYGQLGIGSTDYYSHRVPADVTGLTSGVAAVSAGGQHTCVLTTSGGVKCWGYNDHGELGDGTPTTRTTPVDVIGLSSGVAAVSAGGNHTCALMVNGEVKCWGGMLSWRREEAIPNDVTGLTDEVSKVVSGANHNCALTIAGGVKCWGWNHEGQLGDGTTTSGGLPRDVVGLTSGVKDLAAGTENACAILNSGAIKCWGLNTYGQLGDGTQIKRPLPVTVTVFHGPARELSMGSQHTCALTLGGAVYCWGFNGDGQLGDGTLTQQNTPASVAGLPGSAAQVTTGYEHTCALTTGGAVMCWGRNATGELGDGTFINRYYPGYVSGLSSGIQELSGSKLHNCTSALDGSLRCWGHNPYGQLGEGTTVTRNVPVPTSGLASALVAFSAGGYHTCAMVGVAGTNDYGAQCWGYNSYGQLGDGTTTQSSSPVYVTGLDNGVQAIAAGGQHTCALTTGGGVKCWGYNSYGQLGDGTQTARFMPTDVTGLSSGVIAIAAGENNTCALTDVGGLKCWGRNDAGQVGDRTSVNRFTPTDVYGLTSGVVSVSVGGLHICAVTIVGAAKCWGENIYGQIGDGTTTQRNSSVNVTGLTSGVMSISAGGQHTCALLDSGDIKCWGNDHTGQLSVGRLEYSLTPIRVVGIDDTSLFTITGTVTSFLGPMPGVTVSLANVMGILEQKNTGADGSFSFSNYAAGSYTLTPSNLYSSFSPASLAVSLSDADISDLAFVAHYQPADISGTVSRQGQVLSGVSVQLLGASGAPVYAITDSNGRYSFATVSEGMVTLEPFSPIYTFTPAARQVSVTGQALDGLDFSADYPRAAISGTVLHGTAPLAGVTMSLRDGSGELAQRTTDEDGLFAFPDLPAGEYQLVVQKMNYTFSPAWQMITLTGRDVLDLVFHGSYEATNYLPMILQNGY